MAYTVCSFFAFFREMGAGLGQDLWAHVDVGIELHASPKWIQGRLQGLSLYISIMCIGLKLHSVLYRNSVVFR